MFPFLLIFKPDTVLYHFTVPQIISVLNNARNGEDKDVDYEMSEETMTGSENEETPDRYLFEGIKSH